MLLKKLGVTVVLAGDGEEAVEAMGRERSTSSSWISRCRS
jgi:CheY-like chemotaxis protein